MNTYKIHFDGGYENGTVSYAYVVYKNNEWLTDAAYKCHRPGLTTNIAEYFGLIAALHAVTKIGADYRDDIKIIGDSQLVIRQMTGEYKVNDDFLKILHMQAQSVAYHNIVLKNLKLTFEWLPREHNEAADRLCKNLP